MMEGQHMARKVSIQPGRIADDLQAHNRRTLAHGVEVDAWRGSQVHEEEVCHVTRNVSTHLMKVSTGRERW
jgi:hypothetical protein